MTKWFKRRKFLPLSVCTASLILVSQLAVGSAPSVQAAAAVGVKVSLPAFPVSINGVTLDPSKAQYPPIVYKDITYFPMTWDYTQTLGLPYTWSETEGLRITGYGERHQQRPSVDTGGSSKNKVYTAVPVTYPVTVNEKPINNSAEEYPLLNFRDITYFPMTWRFMHDEFHMKLSWDAKNGFAVISPQRHYMFSIVNDDADNLYLYSGSETYKIRKALNELPALLTDEETQKLTSLPVRGEQKVLSSAEFKKPASPSAERKPKVFYYKGQELFPLAPKDSASQGFAEGEAPGKVYTETLLDLGQGKSILSLKETDSTMEVAADFFTYYRYFYLDASGQPVPLNGYTRWPISLTTRTRTVPGG